MLAHVVVIFLAFSGVWCACPFKVARGTAEVTCPDGNYCRATQMCCVRKSGDYGCCPVGYICAGVNKCNPHSWRFLQGVPQKPSLNYEM